jgi:hypothetical protein
MSYDYVEAGFDGFLSRSIDDVSQVNLDSGGPRPMTQAYDRMQVSGQLGDSFQVGKIQIDGVRGRLSIVDDNGNEVVRIGELDD